MKKIWGLFVGEELIEKSEKRTELIEKRDELLKKGKRAYISLWLGALDKNGKIQEDEDG
jgi:hypothetical protein